MTLGRLLSGYEAATSADMLSELDASAVRLAPGFSVHQLRDLREAARKARERVKREAERRQK